MRARSVFSSALRRASARHATLTLVASFGLACADDIPSDPYARVAGRVRYAGAAETTMRAPVLSVGLFTSFPPTGVPFANISIPRPGLDAEGTPYELLGVVERAEYYLLAALLDSATPEVTPSVVGGYPNFCALLGERGPLSVAKGARLEDVDLQLFEGSGATDPCFLPPAPDAGVEPDAGAPLEDGGT